MGYTESDDGYKIERKVMKEILRDQLGWEIKTTHEHGHDFLGRPPGGESMYCDIKAFKDRVKSSVPAGQQKGRPFVRKESHDMLMRQENPHYLWVKYKKPNGDIEILELRLKHASAIQLKSKRACVSLKIVEDSELVWRCEDGD